MAEHDPKKHIESLRDHLASPGSATCFLFGAGTSCSIRVPPSGNSLIPAIGPLTEHCKNQVAALGKDASAAWQSIEDLCKSNGKQANIENILSNIRIRLDAIGESESSLSLPRKRLKEMEETICRAIAKIVNPDLTTLPSDSPHFKFAKWIKLAKRSSAIELFTTNYDVLFELCLESSGVPVFDGFIGCHTPFFLPECLEDESLLPSVRWVRLWKVHGSVTWKNHTLFSRQVLTRCSPTDTGEMILPSQRKYDESRKLPYTALMDRLTKVLFRERSLLLISGYSFGDEHINSVIFSALEARPSSHVIALQFPNLKPNDTIVKIAEKLKNFTVYGRDAAVISGQYGQWKLTNPIDPKVADFMTCGFKTDPKAPSALTGEFLLGDFADFGKFLETLEY